MSIIADFAEIAKRARELRAPQPDPVCPKCEGGGWTAYGLGRGDPHFRECQTCGNPGGHRSP